MARLDAVLGGAWWRELVDHGVSRRRAVDAIVRGFVGRLGLGDRNADLCDSSAAPSRSQAGLSTSFSEQGALSVYGILRMTRPVPLRNGGDTFDAQESAELEKKVGIEPMFPASLLMRRQNLSEVEAEGRPVIAENIARLVASRGPCRMGDFPCRGLWELPWTST